MAEEKYNGWANYETWKLALNINNEQGFQELVYEWIDDNRADLDYTEFQDWLEQYSEDINTEEINELGFKFCDFWSTNEWAEIDFREVLGSLAEDYFTSLYYQLQK